MENLNEVADEYGDKYFISQQSRLIEDIEGAISKDETSEPIDKEDFNINDKNKKIEKESKDASKQ